MSEWNLPRPDLYIAALGRSGSTMLANLFSTPPNRWVIIEPRFADASTGRGVIAQAREMQFGIAPEEWTLREAEEPSTRIDRVFAHRLARLERWGLKEVRADLIEPTARMSAPKHTIILVRDIRDAAVSLMLKTERDSDPTTHDEAWVRDYLTASPRAILSLLSGIGVAGDHRIVRYEDLVAAPSVREDLSSWLDWPLDGKPDRYFASVFSREREAALHGGEVTARALDRVKTSSSDAAGRIAEWAHNQNREYQERFGYDHVR